MYNMTVTHASLVTAVNNADANDSALVDSVLQAVDTALQSAVSKLNARTPVNSFIFVKTNQYKKVVDKAVAHLVSLGFNAETYFKRGVIPQLDTYFVKVELS